MLQVLSLYPNRSWILLVFMLLGACGKKPADSGNNWVAGNGPTFTVASRDTLLQVWIEAGADSLQMLKVLLNGNETPFRLQAATLSAANNHTRKGLNSLQLIFLSGGKQDTSELEFVHSPRIPYTVQGEIPHNPAHFTQGLFFTDDGFLLESTGLTGQSKIMRYRLQGSQLSPADSFLNRNDEFGEGITTHDGELIQLLWRNRYLKVLDPATLELKEEIAYAEEGWGICSNGQALYASNGTGVLQMLDISGNPAQVISTVPVKSPAGPVTYLNELEFVREVILANVWQSNQIYFIDPSSGAVVGILDLAGIVEEQKKINPDADVLNGIAWKDNRLFVTGKLWNRIYVLEIPAGYFSLKPEAAHV